MRKIDHIHPPGAVSRPRGLGSLWDLMLKIAALEFGRALVDLRMLDAACEQIAKAPPEKITDIDAQTLHGHIIQVLGNLKRVCILSDLPDVLPEIERFAASLKRGLDCKDIQSRCDHLRHRLYDELKNEHYFQVDREDVRFYDQTEIFGSEVAKKFKRAATDLRKAGSCLALQQPDACVFHLMRAMEVAVRQLAKRLNLTITPQTTWRQMTGQMDDKIKKMPEATDRQKRKKNDWEAARANLHHVGSVWRNNTMHPATSYTRGQARDVFDAVRVFMIGLCKL